MRKRYLLFTNREGGTLYHVAVWSPGTRRKMKDIKAYVRLLRESYPKMILIDARGQWPIIDRNNHTRLIDDFLRDSMKPKKMRKVWSLK